MPLSCLAATRGNTVPVPTAAIRCAHKCTDADRFMDLNRSSPHGLWPLIGDENADYAPVFLVWKCARHVQAATFQATAEPSKPTLRMGEAGPGAGLQASTWSRAGRPPQEGSPGRIGKPSAGLGQIPRASASEVVAHPPCASPSKADAPQRRMAGRRHNSAILRHRTFSRSPAFSRMGPQLWGLQS